MATDPASTDPAGTVTVGQFVALLHRRWKIVAAGLLAGLVVAATALAASPAQFESRAVVTVSPIDDNPLQEGTGSVNTVTESNVVASSSVAERAAELLEGRVDPSSLLERVDVTSPLGSQVLEISFSADAPADAADGANAFAEGYLAYRQETAEGNNTRRVERLEEQVVALQAQVVATEQQLASEENPERRAQLEAGRGQLGNQVDELRRQQTTLRTAQVVPGQLIDRGRPPSGAGRQRMLVFLAAGLLVGGVLGTAVAVWRDRRDDRIVGESDLSAAPPVLVAVPRERTDVTQRPSGRRDGPEADAYAQLSTKLLAPSVAGETRTFLLVRAGPGGEEEPLPAHLAGAFAAQGLRVVIAGCSPAISVAVRLLALTAPPQTGENVPDTGQLHAVTTEDGLDLVLLDLGAETSVEGRLFRGKGEVEAVVYAADVVVIDAVNVQHASTSLSLGQLAGGAVVLASQARTRRADVRQTVLELTQVGVPLVGSVLTRLEGRRLTGRRRPPSEIRPETEAVAVPETPVSQASTAGHKPWRPASRPAVPSRPMSSTAAQRRGPKVAGRPVRVGDRGAAEE